ncbi:MAG: hypothetical protein ACYTAN_05145 [Planctomycetota bacterium]
MTLRESVARFSPAVGKACRAGLATLLVLALFVTIATLATARRGGAPDEPTLRSSQDWFALLRLSIAAFVVSGAGLLVYRHASSRVFVLAVALGVIFVNVDAARVVDEVNRSVGPPLGIEAREALKADETGKLADEMGQLGHGRMMLYCFYYLFYCFWVVIILYSGYLGQYVVDRLVTRSLTALRESALYIAENAGVGLVAGLISGVLAMTMTGAMVAFVVRDVSFARQEVWGFPAGIGSTQAPDREAEGGGAAAEAPGRVAESGGPTPVETEKPERTGAEQPRDKGGTADTGSGQYDYSRLPRLRRLKAYALVVFLTFFLAAYTAAIVVRPRTSTWVACGAIIGAMTAPLAAALVPLSWPRINLLLLSLLELSPFTLTGLAVAAALLGDWLGKEAVAYARSRDTAPRLKPL